MKGVLVFTEKIYETDDSANTEKTRPSVTYAKDSLAGWQKLRGSTGGTRRKVWTRTKISLFGGRALHLPSLRSPVEEAQAGLLLLREEVASLRSIFLSMTSQGHLASLMPASAGTCASRGSASRQSRCALGAFSSTEL